MIALVSTTIRGSPLRASSRAPIAALEEADGLAPRRSGRAASRRSARASRARGRARRRAAATSPHGAGRFDSGKPSSRPISRPSSRPMTAVTNSAVERSSTREISHVGGHERQVRQDREADHDPGDDPRGQQEAGVAGVPEQAATRVGEDEPDEAAERGTQETDIADQQSTSVDVPVVHAAGSVRTARQPSIAGTASPRGRGPLAERRPRSRRGASRPR